MPDGKQFLTGGDTSLIVWDPETGKQIRKLTGHVALIGNVALLPERKAVSGSFDRTIRFWDLESGRETDRFFGHPREVTWVAASPDGKLLLSSDYNGHELRFWDIEGRRLIRQINWQSTAPTRGAFSPNGQFAVWAGSDGAARIYRIGGQDSGIETVPLPPSEKSSPAPRPDAKK